MSFINVMRNRLASIAALSVLIFANCLAQNSAPSDVKVFVGAEILDGSGKSAVKNGVMIVRDGKISISSPIARALIGKSKGETAEVTTPKGARSYEILKIEYK